MGRNCSPVHFYQATHQCQTNTQPALRTLHAMIQLGEQVKYPRQHLRRNTDSRVSHDKSRRRGCADDIESSMCPAAFRVFRRVTKNVRDRLG